MITYFQTGIVTPPWRTERDLLEDVSPGQLVPSSPAHAVISVATTDGGLWGPPMQILIAGSTVDAVKSHLAHLAMCAPMIVVGGVLSATGSGVGVLLPIAGCVAMMWAMMSMGGHAGEK